MAVSNKDGVKFFPAFTDWLEFLKWKNDPDADTMVITFDQYCGILLKQGVDVSGIVINPAETNIVIRKEKMAEMKGVSPEAEQPQEAPKKNNILPLFGCEKVTNPEVIVAADRLRCLLYASPDYHGCCCRGAAAGGDAGFSAKPVPAEAEPASGTESKHCRQTAVAGV